MNKLSTKLRQKQSIVPQQIIKSRLLELSIDELEKDLENDLVYVDLPGFLDKNKDLKEKGVDIVACVSVNDPFVMKAWGEDRNVGEDVLMLSDGNGEFTAAIGLEMDGSGFGLGTRSQRYAMIIDDGVVSVLNVESGPGLDVSSAETILEQL